MAKSSIFIVLASAICLFSFFGSTSCQDNKNKFRVHGSVYCDTCNVQFITKLSEPIAGAKVKLECADFADAKNVTLSTEATTDEKGQYTIEVDGDHAEEDCQVTLVSSSRDDCKKWDQAKHVDQAAKISLTSDNGIIHTPERLANALGFQIDKALPECAQVLKDLSLNPDGTEMDDDDDNDKKN